MGASGAAQQHGQDTDLGCLSYSVWYITSRMQASHIIKYMLKEFLMKINLAYHEISLSFTINCISKTAPEGHCGVDVDEIFIVLNIKHGSF